MFTLQQSSPQNSCLPSVLLTQGNESPIMDILSTSYLSPHWNGSSGFEMISDPYFWSIHEATVCFLDSVLDANVIRQRAVKWFRSFSTECCHNTCWGRREKTISNLETNCKNPVCLPCNYKSGLNAHLGCLPGHPRMVEFIGIRLYLGLINKPFNSRFKLCCLHRRQEDKRTLFIQDHKWVEHFLY